MRPVVAAPIDLIGREAESRTLVARIDAARHGGGGAIVLCGAPGIGKTSVLDAAKAHAEESGFEVLRTTGVQSETHLPFAGLHQLLRLVLRDVDRLPAPYAGALQNAFGFSEEKTPTGPFQVAASILQLLGESAERAPLLLLVDDAQWLDGATAGALAFVARRLESDPIVLIAALRDGFESPFLEAGLPVMAIEPLTHAHAEALLDARSATLAPGQRDRVLRGAAGNPLALVELSIALGGADDADRAFGSTDLPLTTRLERAFADRLESLTPGTRSFLRIAAADERNLVAEMLTAASRLEGREITLEAATEARDAGLVEVEGPELRFRHPLMRSAIHQAMSLQERHATHAALAATLADDPDRRTWHRAAAMVGTDDKISADLAEMAWRAYLRGAVGVAVEATERAAGFTSDPKQRAALLVRACAFAWAIGRTNDILRFLDAIDDAQVPPAEQPHVVILRETYGRGTWFGTSRIPEFIESADRQRVEGDIARGLNALYVIASRCWWSNPSTEIVRAMVTVLERFPVAEDDDRVLAILALASPEDYGATVLERLARRAEPRADFRGEAQHLGEAAQAVGDFVRAERFQEAQVQFCRSQGMLGGLTSELVRLTWTKIQRGDWKSASAMASEAIRLAEETRQRNWTAAASLAAATIAAYRGEFDEAERLTAAGAALIVPSNSNPKLAVVQWPRGVTALAAGRYDEAYHHLRRIFEPSEDAYHPHVRNWVLADLVEAAVYSGHEVEAAAYVGELERILARTGSPQLEGAVRFARALLSPGGDEAVFSGDTGLATWPFTRARLQLAHGLWLRRKRRPADARTPLRAARDTFDALGAAPWGERASQELRASGETSRRRGYDLTDALSSQELQIAQMAAAGLSNKEIGQQLFLSHRTIGSHLYRIFPKLGITARSHLRSALQHRTDRQPD